MAQANSNKKTSEPAISSIPAAELAEIMESRANPPAAPKVEGLSGGTIRETNTVYEDRTITPEVAKPVVYAVERQELPGGTIMETYGNPVGPDKDSE